MEKDIENTASNPTDESDENLIISIGFRDTMAKEHWSDLKKAEGYKFINRDAERCAFEIFRIAYEWAWRDISEISVRLQEADEHIEHQS